SGRWEHGISCDDPDLFDLRVYEGQEGKLVVDLHYDRGLGDLQVELRTFEGGELVATGTDTPTGARLALLVDEPTPMVLYVTGGGAIPYSILPLWGLCQDDDAFEPNDVHAQAVPGDAGEPIAASLCPDDE